MIILFWFIFFGVIVFTLYALSLFESTSKKEKSAKDIELGVKEQRVLELEGQLAPLKKESEKSKYDYVNLQKEIEEAKKKEADLRAELARKDQWAARSVEELNKIKAQSADFNNKSANKEKELQEEFTKNVNLNKELRESKERIQVLDKENKDKFNEIESLKHQLDAHVKQIQSNADIIAELKRKQDGNEWVSKKDFNRLNEEYTKLEKELELKEEKIKGLGQELMRLKQEKQQPKPVQPPPQLQPQPEQKQPEQSAQQNQAKEEAHSEQPSKEEVKEPPEP